ncbi:MAG: ISAs1 family transposase, partial [Gemmatimonadota bacterium]
FSPAGVPLHAQSATAVSDADAAWPSSSLPADPIDAGAAAGEEVLLDLMERFAALDDFRARKWVAHPLPVVLAVAAAAVVTGARSFAAIASWVADLPAEILTVLYDRCPATAPAGQAHHQRRPSKLTIWRVETGIDAGQFDATVGAWLLDRATQNLPRQPVQDHAGDHEPTPAPEPEPVLGPWLADEHGALSVDGKTVRGAVDAEGNQVHLLAAMTHHQGLVAGQVEVGAKTNEIPMLPTLLDQFDISGWTIAADALHTQRATANYLRRRGAHFCFCVKENQPNLFSALSDLPWAQPSISDDHTDRGHGRVERRTIRVLPAPTTTGFPHLRQAYLIERYVSDLAGNTVSAVAALGITSLPATRADPARLAAITRNHWGIESLHWLRDTVYREDDSRVRTRSGPRIMAALRNLAIGAIRLTGRTGITETTRWASRYTHRPAFQILRLTT